MENKGSKKIKALRIIFAVVTVAYIIGMILLIYIFDVNPDLKLHDKISLFGVQIQGAEYLSLERIFFASIPILLFIFSVILWSMYSSEKRGK